MASAEKSRGKWVLFTIALEIPLAETEATEAAVEAAEMRGYNWLARRLKADPSGGREIDLISFKTVPVSDAQLRHRGAPPPAEATTPCRTFGYAVRLRGDLAHGDPAPPWLLRALTLEGDPSPVSFCGITDARAALLTGRPV